MYEIEYTYENDDTGETFDVSISFGAVPYSPARITSDPGTSEPADGGYCEDFQYSVYGYQRTDEDGNIVEDLKEIPKDRQKELDLKFEKLVDGCKWLQDNINEKCCEAAEAENEPDEDRAYDEWKDRGGDLW